MLITDAQLRDALDLPASRDQEVSDMRDAVVALWEGATRRLWERRVGYVETFRPRYNARTLILSLGPVESVATVETADADGSTFTALASTYYAAGGRSIRLLDGSGFSFWPGQVRVTYTGGFTAEPASGQAETPADIRRVLETQARFMLKRTSDAMIATRSQNFEGGAGVFEQADWHPIFAAVAKRHRRLAP